MRVLLGKFDNFTPARANDTDLRISVSHPVAKRGRCVVRLSCMERRLLVLLAAHLGRNIPYEAIIDALYGDDADGGPDSARRSIALLVNTLRISAPGLGFKITAEHGIGLRLELLEELEEVA